MNWLSLQAKPKLNPADGAVAPGFDQMEIFAPKVKRLRKSTAMLIESRCSHVLHPQGGIEAPLPDEFRSGAAMYLTVLGTDPWNAPVCSV